jgi:hypothetical protein
MNSTTAYSSYMPGYTGHMPTIQREEIINKIQHNKHIPGYAGYVQSIKSENKFGESYGKLSTKSLGKAIPKGSEVPPYERYTSTMRESFINQRNVKILSTAELLGVSNRKTTYQKPIPIDTINKFWGVDSQKLKNDEVVQKQSFEQSNKNFWSFVDSNNLDYVEKPPEDFSHSNRAFWGVNKELQEVYPGKKLKIIFNKIVFVFFIFSLLLFLDLKFKPIPGYQGFNRSLTSENIYGATYSNSRKRADELLKKINEEKADQLFKSSKFSY